MCFLHSCCITEYSPSIHHRIPLIFVNYSSPNIYSLSIFHFRLEQTENLEENQKNLLQITDRFFLAIINSSTEFPPQLRSVCHCLYQVRSQRQPAPSRLLHPLNDGTKAGFNAWASTDQSCITSNKGTCFYPLTSSSPLSVCV